MAQVTVTVNNRAYSIACDDGEEAHLRDLAKYVDAQISGLVRSVGQLGEARLLLMGALMIADQLAEADERVEELKRRGEEAADAPPAISADHAARMFESAARRIEALAARLEQS